MADEKKAPTKEYTIVNDGRAARVFFDDDNNAVTIPPRGGRRTIKLNAAQAEQMEKTCSDLGAQMKFSSGDGKSLKSQHDDKDANAAENPGSGSQPQDYAQAERLSRLSGAGVPREEGAEIQRSDTVAGKSEMEAGATEDEVNEAQVGGAVEETGAKSKRKKASKRS